MGVAQSAVVSLGVQLNSAPSIVAARNEEIDVGLDTSVGRIVVTVRRAFPGLANSVWYVVNVQR